MLGFVSQTGFTLLNFPSRSSSSMKERGKHSLKHFGDFSLIVVVSGTRHRSGRAQTSSRNLMLEPKRGEK